MNIIDNDVEDVRRQIADATVRLGLEERLFDLAIIVANAELDTLLGHSLLDAINAIIKIQFQ